MGAPGHLKSFPGADCVSQTAHVAPALSRWIISSRPKCNRLLLISIPPPSPETRMLTKDPRRRASVAELLAHPWLSGPASQSSARARSANANKRGPAALPAPLLPAAGAAAGAAGGAAGPPQPLVPPDVVVSRLQAFAAKGLLDRRVRRVAVSLLHEKQVRSWGRGGGLCGRARALAVVDGMSFCFGAHNLLEPAGIGRGEERLSILIPIQSCMISKHWCILMGLLGGRSNRCSILQQHPPPSLSMTMSALSAQYLVHSIIDHGYP